MNKKILLALILLLLTNCNNKEKIIKNNKIENIEQINNNILDIWEIPDKFKLTINSLKTQDIEIKKLRSEFSYKKSEMVIMLTYTYENISNNKDDEILLEPFYLEDEKGGISEKYTPLQTKNLPRSILPGEKITVQIPYGIKNKSSKLKIIFDTYIVDKIYKKTFEIDVEN